ncbi:putative Fe-S oxidoreductase [Burkholderia singularis]|uniref:Putative Fe-S oxidoreductase n=1 Tax=Burkholderia singularis TaxID=1503053 RepID=A0A238HAY4_9BURK|nr:putative Fe-S oxidoreductase [Burkholderia singularis]
MAGPRRAAMSRASVALLAALATPAAQAAADDVASLYGPQPPANATYLRVVNLSAHAVRVALPGSAGASRLEAGAATRLSVVTPGTPLDVAVDGRPLVASAAHVGEAGDAGDATRANAADAAGANSLANSSGGASVKPSANPPDSPSAGASAARARAAAPSAGAQTTPARGASPLASAPASPTDVAAAQAASARVAGHASAGFAITVAITRDANGWHGMLAAVPRTGADAMRATLNVFNFAPGCDGRISLAGNGPAVFQHVPAAQAATRSVRPVAARLTGQCANVAPAAPAAALALPALAAGDSYSLFLSGSASKPALSGARDDLAWPAAPR